MTQCCDLIIEVGNTESSIHNVNQQVINILSLSHLCLQEYIESKVLTLSCLDKYKKDKICAQVPIEQCTCTYVALSHTFVKIFLLKSTLFTFIKLTILIYVCMYFFTETDRSNKMSGDTNKPSPPPYPLAGATLPPSSNLLTMGPMHLASYDNANIPYPRFVFNFNSLFS